MKKLLNLKPWLTIADTAKHLSKIFDDDVSEAEVLRLAIDGRLRLSVYFVNQAKARCGKIVPIAGAEYEEVPSLEGIGTVRLYKGPTLFSADGTPSHVIELEETVVTLSGVYDLTMLGDELQEIEHRYQLLTGGPAVTTVGLDGSFVKGRCEKICQLQDEESNHPTGGLPEDSVLVVRTEVLREFEESIGDIAANRDKPLSTPEVKAHIKYIARLHLEHPNATAPEIMRICRERTTREGSPFTVNGRDIYLKGKTYPISDKTFANYFTNAKKIATRSR